MAAIQKYKEYFKPDEIPAPLVQLIEFADAQSGWFNGGFELECDMDDGMFSTYSKEPEFLNSLFAIGQANSSGSTYGIWRQGGAPDIAPIVIFGDEGGVHIVAKDILGLLRILTLDSEPMVSWDEVIYYKPKDAEPSEGAARYRHWLAKNFDIKPVRDAEEVMQIVSEAQSSLEKPLQEWLKRFCK